MRIASLVVLVLGTLCPVYLQAGDVLVGSAAVNIAADDSMVIGGGIGPGKATGQEGALTLSSERGSVHIEPVRWK